jgi:hypothetical protein
LTQNYQKLINSIQKHQNPAFLHHKNIGNAEFLLKIFSNTFKFNHFNQISIKKHQNSTFLDPKTQKIKLLFNSTVCKRFSERNTVLLALRPLPRRRCYLRRLAHFPVPIRPRR